MSISSEEAAEIKGKITSLENTVVNLAVSIDKHAETCTEILIEMKDRDVRNEYQQKEIAEIKKQQEKDKDAIDWARSWMNTFASIWGGITSNTGRFISIILIVGVAMALGIDFTNIKVG